MRKLTRRDFIVITAGGAAAAAVAAACGGDDDDDDGSVTPAATLAGSPPGLGAAPSLSPAWPAQAPVRRTASNGNGQQEGRGMGSTVVE